MPTDLRSELGLLADASGPASPPDDLWTRGVRRRRRVRAGSALATATAVLAAAVVGTAGWDSLRAQGAQPVSETTAPAIPDRLEGPSRWMPSTAEAGPIGPLAAVAEAGRGSFWSMDEHGVPVGVSATTGEYRFLDLPGAFDDLGGIEATPPALSPDGRSVAYWTAEEDHPDRVGGFAVYDTVTGDVTSRTVPTELGLGADALDWASPTTVLLAYGLVSERRADGTSVRDIEDRLWTPGENRLVETGQPSGFYEVWPVPEGYAVGATQRVVTRDPRTGQRVGIDRLDGNKRMQSLAIDPTGSTAVGFVDRRSGPSQLWVADLETEDVDGRTRMVEVPTTLDMVRPALGWQDAGHVVVRAADADDVAGAYAVDIRTGEHTLLVREEALAFWDFPRYAAQLWQTPTVQRPGPERIVDPRLRATGAGAAVLALATGFLMVRRRRAQA